MSIIRWGNETFVNSLWTTTSGSVATGLADGGYAIAWGGGPGYNMQAYHANGTPSGTEHHYITPPHHDGSRHVIDLDIAGLLNGTVAVAFVTEEIYFPSSVPEIFSEHSVIDTDGTVVGGGGGGVGNVELAMTALPSGGFLVAYGGSGGVAAGFYGSDGHIDLVRGMFGSFQVSSIGGRHTSPDVSSLTGGRLAFVWNESKFNAHDAIHIRLFDASGTALIPESGQINSNPVEDPAPHIAALTGGSFVVTYSTVSSNVIARLINANGVPITPEFAINTSAGSADHDVVALHSGGFLAVWRSGSEVRAQAFNADATRDGTEFIVNTTSGASGVTASVLSDDRVVVGWKDSSNNVRSQIIDARDGVATGTAMDDVMYGTYGSSYDRMQGLSGNDTIFGLAGNDVLVGGPGIDKMVGGSGNDSFFVDNTADVIIEGAGTGTDNANASVSYTLAPNVSVETLRTTNAAGTSAINLTGNNLANIVIGNNGVNVLNGGGGNDVLIGNLGRDTSTGGGGNDIFRYLATTHSPVGGAFADVILDFDDTGNDLLDLSALSGPVMTYRHNLAFTAAGQVRINDVAGPDVIVEVNTGGTLAADMQIRLGNTTLASMTASDFLL